MSISERFAHFLKQKRLTQREFCKLTGFAYSSITKFISKQTSNPGVNLFVLTKKHFPEVNIEWILTGEGEMWDEEVVDNRGLSHTNNVEAAGEELVFLGTTNKAEKASVIYGDLLETKNQLINSQKEQIESLKSEVARLKKG
jgi:transcriptional regulator with XRE-family HTH domain